MIDRNPRSAAWTAGGQRNARARPSYRAVAQQMGGSVELGEGYAVVTFPTAGQAEAYASWLRKVRRREIVYTGGTVVTVRR